MKQATNTQQHKYCIRWLKQQGSSQKRTLQVLSLLSIVLFSSHLVLFWFLTHWVQSYIVDTRGIEFMSHTTSLTAIIAMMLVSLVLNRIHLALSERCESHLFTHVQEQLHMLLSRGQYALTRSHSSYFWQQIWLTHIPTIAAFNVRYIVQQRFVMAVPLIVLACVFPLNWVVGLSLLLSLPVVPLFMIVIGKGAAHLHQRHFKAMERLGSIFVDRIKALLLLRVFNAHDRQSTLLSHASTELNNRTMNVVGVAFLSATALDFFSTLAVALVAVFVGFNLLGEFTLGGHLTLQTGLFLLLVAPLCFAELKQLGRLYHLRAEALAVAETLIPIFDTQHTDAATEKHITVDTHTFTALDWRDFSAPIPHITAQTMTLCKGDWVWLDGNSGSGKTCLLECLMGQRDATHSFTSATLVSQHPVIMPTSIRENLTLGRSIDDTALMTVLNNVELSEWLTNQQHGLDTILDERIPMSGGQQQRLSLARILLRNAEVILLDEPTAHLTTEQHQRLCRIIRATFKDKTVIWASHKPLPPEWFDRRWNMHEGVLTQ